MRPPLSRVLAISPGDHARSRRIEHLVAAIAHAGVDMVVLREPHLTERAYVTLARSLAPLLPHGLILHASHPHAIEVAQVSGWGLHLPAAVAPGPLRDGVSGILGASCHDEHELDRAAQAGCDYATLSPFQTPFSKTDDTRRPLDGDHFRRLASACPIPVIALGGVDPTNARSCRAQGAYGVAAITALFPPAAIPEECAALAIALQRAAL